MGDIRKLKRYTAYFSNEDHPEDESQHRTESFDDDDCSGVDPGQYANDVLMGHGECLDDVTEEDIEIEKMTGTAVLVLCRTPADAAEVKTILRMSEDNAGTPDTMLTCSVDFEWKEERADVPENGGAWHYNQLLPLAHYDTTNIITALIPEVMPENHPERKYIENKGGRCPHCNSLDIEGQEVVIDAGTATQEIGCNDCSSTWTDVYRLVGYTDFDPKHDD